ncbi:YitT family protein [Phocaeicola abscessus]|uniref:YitT family protein n=1 Tax=Phocaeicola abscessus TaxID=555313 RepID=UPI000386549E|nr:YitT family protein [Phocaeicola abscessus]EPT34778.1 PF10035 family protein [Bacteroidetes bacterium oral taxon 272 str. F0290]
MNNTQITESIKKEWKDYIIIAIGTIIISLGFAVFLLPYKLTTGGITGACTIVYYVTGIEIQYTYFFVNVLLLGIALKILGLRFLIKTIYATLSLTLFLGLAQIFVKAGKSELPQLLGPNQEFMAAVVGGCLVGLGVGMVFSKNGSTGGTDIIAWVINKYRDVPLGQLMMYLDIIIVSSCYFVFSDWKRVLFGYCILFISNFVLDYVINAARQSVQFLIFSKKYNEIAEAINTRVRRGVTLIDGIGWYSKIEIKVVVVLARKNQALDIFRLVKEIDPNAFISQSNVVGVYGEGFDKLKIK